MTAQAVGVGCTHYRCFQQSVVAIHAHERFYDEHHKAQVVVIALARRMQQHARIGRQAPIVVLSAAVNAGERLFVEQHAETVLACHFLHERHQ